VADAHQLSKIAYNHKMYCKVHGQRACKVPADYLRVQLLFCKIQCDKPRCKDGGMYRALHEYWLVVVCKVERACRARNNSNQQNLQHNILLPSLAISFLTLLFTRFFSSVCRRINSTRLMLAYHCTTRSICFK